MCDLLLDLLRYSNEEILDVEKVIEDDKQTQRSGKSYSVNFLTKKVYDSSLS
jgi:hypothetical protein